jgi:3-hydroxyisobutyrate dehydrogenase-like beta-hydroxyacid dehydrogenase
MTNQDLTKHTIGWVGAGRMGYHMAERLIKAGCDVTVMDIIPEKIEPLGKMGAKLVTACADVADRDIVFFSVPGPSDLKEAVLGANGVLSRRDKAPGLLVDCSSVSVEASSEVREAAEKRGTDMLVASVSGNHHVIKAGKLTVVSSGPEKAFNLAKPYLDVIAPGGDSYVGEGDLARMVKICHNVLLAVYAQNLAEITVLAEKFGVPRHAFMEFINKSVMGSVFSRYKTPAIVNLDFSVTFTPHLLKKDLDLGLAAGRKLDVPMPVTAATREMVQTMIGYGYVDVDFMALLLLEAKAANLDLKPENVEVSDGLAD